MEAWRQAVNIRAYCDKTETIHIVNVLDGKTPPPPIPEDSDESHWIEELKFGKRTYNFVSKYKRKKMPSFTLESGVRVTIGHKLGFAKP